MSRCTRFIIDISCVPLRLEDLSSLNEENYLHASICYLTIQVFLSRRSQQPQVIFTYLTASTSEALTIKRLSELPDVQPVALVYPVNNQNEITKRLTHNPIPLFIHRRSEPPSIGTVRAYYPRYLLCMGLRTTNLLPRVSRARQRRSLISVRSYTDSGSNQQSYGVK